MIYCAVSSSVSSIFYLLVYTLLCYMCGSPCTSCRSSSVSMSQQLTAVRERAQCPLESVCRRTARHLFHLAEVWPEK